MANRQQLQDKLAPSVATLGYDIWHCELVSAGQHKVLRLLIESDNGVNAEGCARVSRQVSALLDVEDLVKGRYTLEVSSPGLDRPLIKLDHFKQYCGRDIKCKLRMPVDGRRQIVGQIQGCQDERIQLKTDLGVIDIKLGDIDKANLIPDL